MEVKYGDDDYNSRQWSFLRLLTQKYTLQFVLTNFKSVI